MAKRTTKKSRSKHPKSQAGTQASPDRWMPWLAAGLAMLLFATGFSNPMVAMDDHSATVNNPVVRDFSLQIFTQYNLGMYAPITWLGYAIANGLGGGSPLWFHFFSALVHAANVFLVYRLFRRLEGSTTVAFFVALFFGFHPLQVESVAWIAGFSTPLFSLFYLLALNAWVQYLDGPAWNKKYWFALGFFVLACLSKSLAVTLPLSLLVLDLWLKRSSFSRQALLEKAPFFLAAIGFGLLTFHARAQYGHTLETIVGDYSVADRALMVCHTIVFNWTKILAPVGLSIWYPFEKTAEGGWHWAYYAAPVILALIFGLAWRLRKTTPIVLTGLLFYMANILFALPLYKIGTFALRADRYNYLAILGIFAILTALPGFFKDTRPKLAERLWVGLAILGLGWLFITVNRIRDWGDTIALVNSAMESQGHNSGRAYLWKGMAYGDRGDVKGALENFSKAIQVNPELADAYKFRGGLLGIAKQYEQSLKDLNKYLETYPDDPEILYNRALTLVNLQRWQEALRDLNRTIELAPEFTRAYRARGNVRKQLGDEAGGEADLQEFDRREAK